MEFAVCLPLFALFLAAIMEVNHASMTAATMRAAAEKAGRFGVMEGVSTAEVEALARETAGAAVPGGHVRVLVKNAAAFDAGGDPTSLPATSLPNIELLSARPRQLFLVRVEVTYADVSLIPPFLLKGPDGGPKVIYGQAVNRHE
ncbi:TadE/TadG family type IV pilus assembly protein [Alienimonas sp. DA493]|uniref:TadE/TadG family type IV pilus assembly protein n=1 Tax=Alienimonas sp. DA493 TaxID=3373605 RepID=UPI0037551BC5